MRVFLLAVLVGLALVYNTVFVGGPVADEVPDVSAPLQEPTSQ